ncbi:tyrosine-type recombinase/integrase [Glycomyces albidus]|uniref:tyrosine-type recombinase/integrase n=1 Tax=Glycomyces albidus TaxID=2656774 RepID=UPI00188484CC|nr:site-specific integrase [Glycomyces albidus]
MNEPQEPAEGRKKAPKGEGTVYWDEAKQTYRAEISLGRTKSGKRLRLKAYGTTEAKARRNLRDKVKEHEAGLDTSNSLTVAAVVLDWFEREDRGAAKTLERHKGIIDLHVLPHLGGIKLKELTADDVEDWLHSLKGDLSTDSLKKARSILRRAIRRAQRRDKVGRNVAELVDLPEGRPTRERESMTEAQAGAVFKASQGTWIFSYNVTSANSGARAEELRPLEWAHTHANPVAGERCTCGRVHEETLPPHLEVWESTRESGDTKTEKSRRTVALTPYNAQVLIDWQREQREWRKLRGYKSAGIRYVWGTWNDTVKDAGNIRRMHRTILRRAGLDPKRWSPRDWRRTFVSVASDRGAGEEQIANFVGHKRTSTTRLVYRKQLRPVITRGMEVMNGAYEDPPAEES